MLTLYYRTKVVNNWRDFQMILPEVKYWALSSRSARLDTYWQTTFEKYTLKKQTEVEAK